jgi:hypothetical protein
VASVGAPVARLAKRMNARNRFALGLAGRCPLARRPPSAPGHGRSATRLTIPNRTSLARLAVSGSGFGTARTCGAACGQCRKPTSVAPFSDCSRRLARLARGPTRDADRWLRPFRSLRLVQISIRSLPTITWPLTCACAPSRQASSGTAVASPGTKCDRTSVFTFASAAIRPTSSNGVWLASR